MLFVLPGFVTLGVVLRPYGAAAMTAGFSAWLATPGQTEWASHINLDEAAAGWGFVALCCLVRGKCLLLGAAALALAALSKHQTAVLCVTVLIAACYLRMWGWLAAYAVSAGGATLLWLAYLATAGGTGISDSAARLDWGPGWVGRVLEDRGHSLKYLVWYAGTLRLGVPLLTLAGVGIYRRQLDPLTVACSAWVILTLAFNLGTAAMPGGLTYYLVPCYLPLAVLCGLAFAGKELSPNTVVGILVVAAGSNFAECGLVVTLGPVRVNAGVVAGVVMSGFALVAGRFGPALWLAAAVASASASTLVFAPVGPPDRELIRLVETGRAVGTWEDPRVSYYAGRRVAHAVWEDDWDGSDYFIISEATHVRGRHAARWAAFRDFLEARYEVVGRGGGYTAWRKK